MRVWLLLGTKQSRLTLIWFCGDLMHVLVYYAFMYVASFWNAYLLYCMY